MRASTLCYFRGLISPQTFRKTLTASVDNCAEIKNAPAFSGVTHSGRIWRKVPESDAHVRSVIETVLRVSLRLESDHNFPLETLVRNKDNEDAA